ncbi:MAG: response regulator [Eudoraea sp.]|nr:response regulator [Muriicola sp.]NNE03942.1 response regulator [Eudoraea sp.]
MKKINTICIIDDDPITVFGIKKMLNAIEVAEEIKTYVNGKQAIDEITAMVENKEDIPEVIFLDINMPIMDGWQFLEKFIALPIEKKIKINVVTSSIDPYDKQQWELYNSKTHHVVDYKNKPIRKGDIIEITKAA